MKEEAIAGECNVLSISINPNALWVLRPTFPKYKNVEFYVGRRFVDSALLASVFCEEGGAGGLPPG